jgi:hypothetical protein
MRSPRLSLVALVCVLLSTLTIHTRAQTPLRNMAGPQGGTIVYGTVDGANTPPAAMGSVLRQLHKQYGDRPVVGRVFRVHGTDSDAVFFTLTRHSPSTLKIAGMLLVSSAPGHVEAALLSDDASRFGTSINPMLQKLFEVWAPANKALGASSSAPNRTDGASSAFVPAAPLHPYRLPDGSATMMLADGWRVAPQSGGGTILAQGPRGETVALGFPYLAYNSSDPRTAQMRNFAMSAAGRNTSYAKNLYAPYGADLGRTFVELNAQARRVGSPAVVAVQVEQSQPVRASGPAHCSILSGHSPASQGQQALQFEGTFCQSQLDPTGGFMNLANLAFVPEELAANERATLRAMLGSFKVNQALVNAQAAALAQPTIDAIHQIGRDVNARIAESDRQNAERRSAFEQHNDAMDRSSQAFSNYILDKTVILDNEHNAHGTVWNDTAKALVESNPKRFEYVDTPGYWQGIDY